MPRSSGKGYRQRPLRRYGFFIAVAGLIALLLLQTSPRLSEGVEPIRTAASDQLFHVTRPSLIDRLSGASARERQIRELEYVSAARSIGSTDRQILFYEILPNLSNQIIVVFSLEMAVVIIHEAALSFLGVGVQPPTASWGLMIAEGKEAMYFKPYLVAIPGAALFLLVLAVNLLGDGIRDITAPEGRN